MVKEKLDKLVSESDEEQRAKRNVTLQISNTNELQNSCQSKIESAPNTSRISENATDFIAMQILVSQGSLS